MIELESIAHKLVEVIYGDAQFTEQEKAQIEYGFSLTLGLAVTMVLALIPALFLGSLLSTSLVMVSALVVRLFSGGGHCSSYGRCLLLSLLIFVPAGLLVKVLAATAPVQVLISVNIVLALAPILYTLGKQSKLAFLMATLQGVALVPSFLKGRWLPAISLAVAVGVFTQAAIATKAGEKVVETVDVLLRSVRKQ